MRSSVIAPGENEASAGSSGPRSLLRNMSSIARRAQQLQTLDELLLKGANLEVPTPEVSDTMVFGCMHIKLGVAGAVVLAVISGRWEMSS